MAKPKTSQEVQAALDGVLDRQLLAIITKGRPVVGADGQVVKDENGKVEHRPPSAADLQVARGRLKDLGISKMVLSGSDADRLRLGLEKGEDPYVNYKVPPLDMHSDDAATG